jgi:hypothetical protein
MTLPECPRCGAVSPGPHCDYCGAPLASADPAAERAALDELHLRLAGKDPGEQVTLLDRAFLPDHPQALIEAGLRCVALLGTRSFGPVADALAGRLEAVTAKLRIGDQDPESLRAAQELGRQLERFRRHQRRSAAVGLGAFLALAAGLGWAVWALVHWLRGR